MWPSPCPLPAGEGRGAVRRAILLDAAGREVIELPAGANDVRALSPGVHFVRQEPRAPESKPQAVLRVVVAR